MQKLALSVGLIGLLLSASCAGPRDGRIDADAPDPVGGVGLQSQDIRTMAKRMADDLRSAGVLQSTANGQQVAFHITEMKNESAMPISRTIILNKIQTELFRALGGRVEINDRTAEGLDAVKREREAKRTGAVQANEGMKGAVAGSDYALMGTIQDLRKQSGRLKTAYYLVTFKLVDLETGKMRWTSDYETKFESEKSVIDG